MVIDKLIQHKGYKEQKARLIALLEKEIRLLRELVDSVYIEQHKILESKTSEVAEIVKARELILVELVKAREERIELNKEVEELKNTIVKDDEFIDNEIAVYFEQINELLKRTHKQAFSNSYLLKNKVLFVRELFEKLQPKNTEPLYSSKGVKKNREKVSTLTLINKEV